MATISNQYADKVFGEHPIALWPLDDPVYYLSLIDDNDRLFSNWTLTNATFNNNPTLPDIASPFNDNIYSSITANTTSPVLVEAVSPELFSLNDVNIDTNTFCINLFLFQKPTYINWFKIGYRYQDALSNPQEVISEQITPPQTQSWININKVYSLPSSWSGSLKIFIQVNFSNSAGGDASSRTVIMQGLSVGQDSQTTCYENLGSTAQNLPDSMGFTSLYGISADQYGVLSDNGYYTVRNNQLLAKNDGFPIVFGTNQSTKIYPSEANLPSFVFPGKGMLNETGRNKNYSLETWIKIDPQTTMAKKIIGPISTSDGIYVKEGFLTLAIGNEISSHCVSEWYRPMLLHLTLRENNATVMINGETVIDIPLDRKKIDLPNDRDWWGIYSYPEISLFQIDCISIYPYIVSETVAKRKFIYAQGTPSIQSIDNSFLGTPTTIDFTTSNYGSSVIYPDIYRWDAGNFNNLTATRDYLSVPNYSLPTISLGGRNLAEWYEDNNIVNNSEYPDGTHPNFFTFRPNQGTRTNLIPNPSFETNTSNWYGSGTAVATIGRSTTKFYTKVASMTGTATVNGNIRMYQGDGTSATYISILPNTTYTLSGYSLAATTARQVDVHIEWFTSTDVAISTSTGTAVSNNSTTWTRSMVTATAPSNATKARVSIRALSAVIGEMHYFDAILFEQSSVAQPYFDGSYADPAAKAISTSWSGTANASTSSMTYWDPNGINYQEESYLNFPTLNILNDPMSAAYAIFEAEEDISFDRPLMTFVNSTNGDVFSISINSDSVLYAINDNVLHEEVITLGQEFLIGINFERASAQFGFDVSRFFSSPSSIQLYVGGDGIHTFEGKIYLIGFCNQVNFQKVENSFDSSGIAISSNYEILIDHISSYTLIPEYEYEKMFLDISVASEWEEYYPLSFFAGYVKDENGNMKYDLDLMQINIGYTFVESEGAWTYQELKNEFAGDTYAQLLPPTYSNYFNLYKNNFLGENINVSRSSLNAFLTFQKISDGPNLPLSSFSNTNALPANSVIYADDVNTVQFPERVYDTKFVIKDNVVVYPPKTQNFEEYSMVVHFEIKQRSIIKNPLKIKTMQISAKNLNEVALVNPQSQRNIIGTKFGIPIYPQKFISGVSDYKDKNPIFIYKTTSPYLYTTKKSGIKLANTTTGQASPTNKFVASIPINSNGSYDFFVGAIHFFAKGEFSQQIENIRLIDVKHKDGVISIILEKTAEGNFVKAYLNNGTTLTKYTNIEFYQNGRYVLEPSLVNNEWNSIGMSFTNQLDFSEYQDGSIDLFGGAVFNNISYYLSKGLGIKTDLTIRSWENVLNFNSVKRAWSFWDAGSQTWRDVYILGQISSYFSDPADIYHAYTGTNKNIVDDNMGVVFGKAQSSVYSQVLWQTSTKKPV